MRISALPFIASMAFLSACASPPSLDTPSGKPEVHIGGKSKKQVVDGIMNWHLSNGWSSTEVSEYRVVLEKRVTSLMKQFILDSSKAPVYRRIFEIIEVGGRVRVVCTVYTVERPHTPKEFRYGATKKLNQECRNTLSQL